MATLVWQEAGVVTMGNLIAHINRAPLGNGNVFHSVRICRTDEGGKTTQFLRVDDLKALAEFSEKVRHWIQSDTEEIRKAG